MFLAEYADMIAWMNRRLRAFSCACGCSALLGASGCSHRLTSYTPLYEQQTVIVQGQVPDQAAADALARRFVTTFGLMGTPDFLPAAEQLFAHDSLYINDTLSVYRDHAQLARHLAEMNQSLKSAKVTLLDDWVSKDSIYVHWRMDYRISVLGVQKEMASYGISQLKMNAAGQIVFQQDYWDSNNGLYRQLPVVGWFYRWALPFKGL